MKYQFNSDEELTQFIANNIVPTREAMEILGCTRQNIDDLIKREKLTPIKKWDRDKLFWKPDILKRAYSFYRLRIKILTNRQDALKELKQNLNDVLIFKEAVFEILDESKNWFEIRLRTKSNPHPRYVQDSLVGFSIDAYNTYDEIWPEVERSGSYLLKELVNYKPSE